MGKDKKRLLFHLGCGLLLVLNGFTAAGYYFYHVAIKRNKKDFLLNSKDLEQNFELAKTVKATEENLREAEIEEPDQNGMKWVEHQNSETWTLIAEDGLKLVGCYIPAKLHTTKTVILAHGYTSCGKEMGAFAKYYYEKLGYNILLPDARGHGASEGDYIGFGWHERKDYLLWISRVLDQVGPEAQIVLHGVSMGAATVMMTSGEILPEQVKVIIEDCGYTAVNDELAYQLKRMYHLPPFPILSFTSVITNFKAGYRFSEASAFNQIKMNKLPMLFIHGDADTFVPTTMVHKLYDACKSEKDILIIEGAGHGLAYTVAPEVYEAKVSEFLGCYIV